MKFFQARTWVEALEIKAAHRTDVVPLAGGTDLMVELNFDRQRPAALLDLSALPELAQWTRRPDGVRIGAGVSMTRAVDELATYLPGLAMAARTVGSPQIRNRATLGGNLATASPAGDTLPPMVVDDAIIELESVRGQRAVRVADFLRGPKQNVLADDELIRSVVVPVADGPRQFAKVGPRNAMVIAVCSFALALHPSRSAVRACAGSAGPVPVDLSDAASFLSDELTQRALWQTRADIAPDVLEQFAQLAGAQIAPIDDVRASARYRRHAVAVLARRTLGWAWDSYRSGR